MPAGAQRFPFVIRNFNFEQDYPSVREFWLKAGAGIRLGRSDEPHEINKKLSRDPDLFLVAEIDHKIIGTVIGGYDGRRGMIYHLAVAQPYRRNGIATSLMDEVENRLRIKGCIKSYLMVRKENLDVMHFYQAQGWEIMDLYMLGKNLT